VETAKGSLWFYSDSAWLKPDIGGGGK